jgi:hypothetical protein
MMEWLQAFHHIMVLLAGLAAVVILALTGHLRDGETIAALSAVLSAALGTRAVEKQNNNGNGGT